MLRGEVHDPRARLLGGVAGHAGMFSTAADLARDLPDAAERRHARRAARVSMPPRCGPCGNCSPKGSGRARSAGTWLGVLAARWRPSSPRARSAISGFTGTAVWIDPQTPSYLIILSNRVHPNGGGAASIRDLRMRVAAAAGAQLFQPPVIADPGPISGPAADGPRARRCGCPGEPSRPGPGPHGARRARRPEILRCSRALGRARHQPDRHRLRGGRRTIDLIAGAPGVRLQAIFSPEHGITGQANDRRAARTRCRHRPADLEPLRHHPAADVGDAQGHHGHGLRHPGRRRPLLHLPHHPGLRHGGGVAGSASRWSSSTGPIPSRGAWSRDR